MGFDREKAGDQQCVDDWPRVQFGLTGGTLGVPNLGNERDFGFWKKEVEWESGREGATVFAVEERILRAVL